MIVAKMLKIADTAKNIWKKEALQFMRITAHKGTNDKWYAEVEAMSIDSEFFDSWELVSLTPIEVESAVRLIRRINFKGENVQYIDGGVEFWVKSSPKVEKIKESIRALYNEEFYSELHQENGCVYSFIIKKTKKAQKELKRYLKSYPNVSCYFEDGIYELYM